VRLAILLLALAVPARADDDTARARAHFEIGNGMYRLGDYAGALREFAAGYELTRKPGFLINLGQTYRKLHDPARAREMYQKYLATTPPDDPARAQVTQILSDLDKEVEPAPSPAPASENAPVVAAPPAADNTLTRPPPPRPRRRALLISGIVLGVAGAALVGGGGGAAASANSEADQLTALDRAGGTFDPGLDDQYHLHRSLEYSLFGVGAALAATGIVLLALGAR
jgi:iron complex outermembrane receptor protein